MEYITTKDFSPFKNNSIMELLIELARLQKTNLRLKWILGILIAIGLAYWILSDEKPKAIAD